MIVGTSVPVSLSKMAERNNTSSREIRKVVLTGQHIHPRRWLEQTEVDSVRLGTWVQWEQSLKAALDPSGKGKHSALEPLVSAVESFYEELKHICNTHVTALAEDEQFPGAETIPAEMLLQEVISLSKCLADGLERIETQMDQDSYHEQIERLGAVEAKRQSLGLPLVDQRVRYCLLGASAHFKMHDATAMPRLANVLKDTADLAITSDDLGSKNSDHKQRLEQYKISATRKIAFWDLEKDGYKFERYNLWTNILRSQADTPSVGKNINTLRNTSHSDWNAALTQYEIQGSKPMAWEKQV